MNERGAALIMSLLVMTLIGAVVFSSLSLSSIDRRVSSNDALAVQAYAMAQAGAAFWKSELVDTLVFMHRNPQRYQDLLVSAPEKLVCGNLLGLGLDLNRDYPGSALVQSGAPLTPAYGATMGGMHGVTDATFEVQGSTVLLHVTGYFGDARATITDTFSISTLDLWNHALFAERASIPLQLAGRSDIRGSVHLLGTHLGPSEPAFNLNGDFLLGNAYSGLHTTVQTQLASMRLSVNDPQDLCASLRVRSGYTQLGGGAALGQANAMGRIQGIYTSHGVRGGTEGGNVHSLNGISTPYDLGNTFSFPTLDSLNPQGLSWRDALEQHALVLSGVPYDASVPGDPRNAEADDRSRLPLVSTSNGTVSIVHNPLGVALDRPGLYYLSEECDDALFEVTPSGTIATGAQPATAFRLELDQTESFVCRKYRMTGSRPNPQRDVLLVEVLWSRTAGMRQVGSQTMSSGVTSAVFGANELYVGGTSGVVVFLGKNLVIAGGQAPGAALTYRGGGVLFAERSDRSNYGFGGSMLLEVDVIPAGGQALRARSTGHVDVVTPGITSSYPVTSLLHLVARDTIIMHGAHKRFAVAIYAQETVKVMQQTLIAGGIVTRVLDAAQVPTILQVSNLGQYVSPLMPGAGNAKVVVTRQSSLRR